MELSESDLRELQLLRDTFTRGEISESAFHRIRKVFLEERNLPEDFDETQYFIPSAELHPSYDIELLTSCSTRAKRNRRKLLAEDRFVTPRTKQQSPRTRRRVPPRESAPTPTPPSEPPPQIIDVRVRGLVSSVFTIGFALAVTVFICQSAPVEQLITSLQPYEATAVSAPSASQLYANHFIRPLYGPVAVEQCIAGCAPGAAAEHCHRACRRLSVSDYARRITAEEANPKTDAAEIVRRCERSETPMLSLVERRSWQDEIESTLTLIESASATVQHDDFGTTRLLYNSMFDANRNLTLPRGGSSAELALTRQLISTTCLTANLALTELAVLVSLQNSDEYSRRYYSAIYRQLRPHTLDRENSVVATARTMGLLPSAVKSGR